MNKIIDSRYHYQDPANVQWLRDFSRLPRSLQYHFANESEFCLTFEADIVDDDRPLLQWMVDRGAMLIVDPKRSYWYGKGVVWYPNSRSRHYGLLTGTDYLVRDWWWKIRFEFDSEYSC